MNGCLLVVVSLYFHQIVVYGDASPKIRLSLKSFCQLIEEVIIFIYIFEPM